MDPDIAITTRHVMEHKAEPIKSKTNYGVAQAL